MKKTILLAAITIISIMAVNSASAQYYNRGRDIRHERADIRYDRQRLDGYNRERRVDAYYGNREAYRYNDLRARGEYRAVERNRREIYRDRRDLHRGRY